MYIEEAERAGLQPEAEKDCQDVEVILGLVNIEGEQVKWDQNAHYEHSQWMQHSQQVEDCQCYGYYHQQVSILQGVLVHPHRWYFGQLKQFLQVPVLLHAFYYKFWANIINYTSLLLLPLVFRPPFALFLAILEFFVSFLLASFFPSFTLVS